MDRRSASLRRLLVVGLFAASTAACGGDGDRAATTTAGTTTAETTTPRSVPATTAPATTVPVATTAAPTTTTAPPTAVTTTTTAPLVVPTWTPAVRLEDSGPESPFGSPGVRVRFAVSDLGVVALQPTGRDDPKAATRPWFSADALAWEPMELIPGERLSAVVAGGPGFVAAGQADSDEPGLSTPAGLLPRPLPVVWTSGDGRTWTPATVDSTPFLFGEIDDLAETTDGWVAVGEVWDDDDLRGPAVWASPDGLTWALQPGDPLGVAREPSRWQVAAGRAGLVAVGVITPIESSGPGPTQIWWSQDGVSWERVPDIGSFSDGSAPVAVVPFGEGFVMVGGRAARVALVWTSPDGRSWADPTVLPVRPVTDSTIVYGLATDGSVLVAFGDDVVFGEGTDPAVGEVSIWMSLDAAVWQQVPPESLRGDELSEGAGPVALVQVDNDWILLGSAADDATGSRVGVAWFGR